MRARVMWLDDHTRLEGCRVFATGGVSSGAPSEPHHKPNGASLDRQ